MAGTNRYLIHLPHFEGPLALLLYLIRKEEMDIFDININLITHQYLEHIRLMRELDLEVAGDFVSMAASLIQIKAKMLLPQYNEEGETVEVEDPRKELVRQLQDYQRYQEGGKRLYDRPLLGRDVFSRGMKEVFVLSNEPEVIVDESGLFGLIASFRKALKKADKFIHRVRPKTQSIAGRILALKDRFVVGVRVLLSDLSGVGDGSLRERLLITFLSILELGRLGYVSVFQNEIYGEIHVETKKEIERNVLERVQEFDSQDAEAIANQLAQTDHIESASALEDPEMTAETPLQASEQSEEFEAVSEEMATDDDLAQAEQELGFTSFDQEDSGGVI